MTGDDPWPRSWSEATNQCQPGPPPPASPSSHRRVDTPVGSHPQGVHRRPIATGAVATIAVAIVIAATFAYLSTSDNKPPATSQSLTGPQTPGVPGSSPTSPATNENGDEPAKRGTSSLVTGAGYTYELPRSWNVGTDPSGASNIPDTIDTLAGEVPPDGAAPTSLIVEAGPAPGATPEDIRGTWTRNATRADTVEPIELASITIDGARAVGLALRDRPNDFDVSMDQIAYLVVHNGRGYALAFTFPADAPRSHATFEAILTSWTWTD